MRKWGGRGAEAAVAGEARCSVGGLLLVDWGEALTRWGKCSAEAAKAELGLTHGC